VFSLTSREFNQDTGRAKRAALAGPVVITDRGRPSHVLMTFTDFEKLTGAGPGIIELLAEPPGVELIEFDPPRLADPSRPATFD
jgi:hypothetical protein